jgi:hypothetical protein
MGVVMEQRCRAWLEADIVCVGEMEANSAR